jgi:transposase
MGRPLKLTRVQIKEICLSTESSRDLAKRFGVSYITILNYRKKYAQTRLESPEADPYLL